MPVPVIEVVGTRFRIVSWKPDDEGRFVWFDSTDPAVIILVLQNERFDLAMHGEDSEGPRVANALREAGLLEHAAWSLEPYGSRLREMLACDCGCICHVCREGHAAGNHTGDCQRHVMGDDEKGGPANVDL